MKQPRRMVRMVPASAEIGGRLLHYAISDNEEVPYNGAPPQMWAVNIHGYLAGGGMYWRESARLASTTGWRVVNPSLPGFGGSEPLEWGSLSMEGFSRTIAGLLDHVGAERAVVLGHSMGGAVAVKFAHDYPERTLGLLYRDGAATASWKERRGILARALSPLSPDLGVMAETLMGVALDVPDLLVGRMLSTLRGIFPDARRNLRSAAATIPVAAMLFAADLREEVATIGRRDGLPIVPLWGRFDRITPRRTAEEFAEVSGRDVVWIQGGHSWMLARPGTQPGILRDSDRGRAFVSAVSARSVPDDLTRQRVRRRERILDPLTLFAGRR